MADNRWTKLAVGAGFAAGVALPVCYLVVQPWHSRWGATDEEVAGAMPGDDLVKDGWDISTRAVTIRATPEDIWPWLVQMGYQLGNMYSYDWIDQAMGILDKPSSREILPEYQHLEPGDVIPMGSGPSWLVHAIEPDRSLVLDVRDPGVSISWSMGLYPQDAGHTRLLLRSRARLAPLMLWLSFFPVSDLGQFLMTRRQLLGIKERADFTAAHRA